MFYHFTIKWIYNKVELVGWFVGVFHDWQNSIDIPDRYGKVSGSKLNF